MSVLHLSDLHLDTLSDPNTYGPDTFCRSQDNLPDKIRDWSDFQGPRRHSLLSKSNRKRNVNNNNNNNNPFGQYLCDSTPALLSGVLGIAFQQPQYDFVVVTGDWAAHQQVNSSTMHYMFDHAVSLVAQAANNVPVVPVIGNEDFFPDYNVRCDDFQLGRHWDSLSNAGFVTSHSQESDFKSMGALVVDNTALSLRIISLNTILWSQRNPHFDDDRDSDPCHQFSWLSDRLDDASQSGLRVWLVGHIPPSFNLWRDSYEAAFLNIVAKHRHNIDVSLWGHTHSNDFVLSKAIPEFFGLIQGSVTPNPVNPSFRVLSVAQSSSGVDVVDFQDVYADLHSVNANNQLAMSPLFSFARTYGSPVSAKSIASLNKLLVHNATWRATFRDLATSRYDNSGFDMACGQFMNETDYWNCRINETM